MIFIVSHVLKIEGKNKYNTIQYNTCVYKYAEGCMYSI
jgi:hypothetical protein